MILSGPFNSSMRKAHPNDGGGQDLIKRIYEISQMPQFTGKSDLPGEFNEHLEMANILSGGFDIWG